MRADLASSRQRSFVRFWGTFMVLVQLTVLYHFFSGFETEVTRTPVLDHDVVLARMSWLRPLPWRQPMLGGLVATFLLALMAIVVTLWVYGLRDCRRGRDD